MPLCWPRAAVYAFGGHVLDGGGRHSVHQRPRQAPKCSSMSEDAGELAMAVRHVAEARRMIAGQRRLVAKMTAAGHANQYW
jgi:hypothetical protein